MAWPGRTWVAGEIVTQSKGNSAWRDPMADLRNGGIAMAGQQAGDFIYAQTSTQWTHVSPVGGRTVNYNGSAWVTANAVGPIVWPVGSIYESVLATNPGSLMGFGTWVAFGTGRVTVGIDAGQVEFDTVEETGGSNAHTLTIAEMPAHNHIQDPHNHLQNSHNHTQDAHDHNFSGIGTVVDVTDDVPHTSVLDNSGTKTTSHETATNQPFTATNNPFTAVNQNEGGGGQHSNLQPYITIYRWKRTA